MTQPAPLAALDALADDYDAVICDVWGVVHDGRAAFPAAVRALTRWRERGGVVALVSNAPRPSAVLPPQLTRLGAPPECYDAVISSGDATRAALAERAPGPMCRIGPAEFDAPLFEGLALEEADLEEAAFVAVSGLNDDARETPADYVERLKLARARDLELICANPDIQVRVGDRLVWCAGALAELYARMGGRVLMAGKPHAPIYQLAYAAIENAAGRTIRRPRILAIGDGVRTDLLGANREGMDALFIAATGLHGGELMSQGRLDAKRVAEALRAEQVFAKFVMPGLA